MPRKTRKQKISAQSRKTIVKAVSPQMDTPIMHAQKSTPTSSGTIFRSTLSQPALTESEKVLRHHTILDITKTLIIICILFAAQAGVYFAQNSGLLSRVLQ